jgi:hypothetical protein
MRKGVTSEKRDYRRQPLAQRGHWMDAFMSAFGTKADMGWCTANVRLPCTLSHDYRVHSQRYLLRRRTMLISKLVSGRTSYVRFGSKAESGGIYPNS